MFRINRFVFTAIVFILATATSSHAAPLWIEQLGTSGSDYSYGVSADLFGNIYISGGTSGNLGGPNAGSGDAFLAKYSAAGALLWTEQLGSSSSDWSQSVSADSLGNVYITGITRGSLGGPNAGFTDTFLAKYDAAGSLQWTKHLGTSDVDHSYGVSADTLGNVYISGWTRGSLGAPNANNLDAFLAKYNAAGSRLWIEQLRTINQDESRGVSADSLGNVYITGVTTGNLGGQQVGSGDVFLAKYDTAGTLQWTEQLGTADSEHSYGVSADTLGNVFISGFTDGSLGGPFAGETGTYGGDAFVAKYDAAGTLQWTEQLGTAGSEISWGVSADSLGNVYISGYTEDSLGGSNAGLDDAFLAKYDTGGTLQWIEQLGTDSDDSSYAVSADSLGNVYISGYTDGSLGGPSAGGRDAFVAKFDADPPIPGDANGDGKVDGLDYVIWANNYGDDPAADPPGSPDNGDFNNDGIVDGIDYVTWAINYGQGPNDGVAVPEPRTWMLLITGVAMLLSPRRRS